MPQEKKIAGRSAACLNPIIVVRAHIPVLLGEARLLLLTAASGPRGGEGEGQWEEHRTGRTEKWGGGLPDGGIFIYFFHSIVSATMLETTGGA